MRTPPVIVVAIAALVTGCGSSTPGSQTTTPRTTKPHSEPGLTGGQTSDANGIATSDPRVAELIGGRPYSIAETTPWTTESGAPIGADVIITWDTPTSITYDWPSPAVVARYTAANVTGLSILVDLACNQVVSIEPDEDSYASDTPTFVSEGSGACGISAFGFNSTRTTAAARRGLWARWTQAGRVSSSVPWTTGPNLGCVHEPADPEVIDRTLAFVDYALNEAASRYDADGESPAARRQ